MEVAELQQQLQLTESEKESLVEQLERNQEELERNQEELDREKRENERERREKEREREEKERGQQELVRQTPLCFITMLIVLFESVFIQLFNRRELAQAQSANQTQQLELVRYFSSAFPQYYYNMYYELLWSLFICSDFLSAFTLYNYLHNSM